MTTPWEHRTAVVNGINIHYVTQGQGPPVIMLHGWPEFWYAWRKQIPVLGTGSGLKRVICRWLNMASNSPICSMTFPPS